MDSLYIPCVEHAKQWLPIPIIQSISIRMLLSLLRSRFLQSGRLVQDKRPSYSVAASELGFFEGKTHSLWYKIAMDEKESILSSVPADFREKGSELYTSLIDGKVLWKQEI